MKKNLKEKWQDYRNAKKAVKMAKKEITITKTNEYQDVNCVCILYYQYYSEKYTEALSLIIKRRCDIFKNCNDADCPMYDKHQAYVSAVQNYQQKRKELLPKLFGRKR